MIFKDGEVQELHGTFGGMVYRYSYGKQRMHMVAMPRLAKDANKKERERHEKECIVRECVAEIQLVEYRQGAQTVARMQQIADEYAAIKKAVERMYDDFQPYFGAMKEKLGEAIVYWYCCKRLPPKLELFRDELPKEYRECER